MRNKKAGIILFAAIYSTCAAFSLFIRDNTRAYRENFISGIFVTAFPRKNAQTSKLAAKIRKMEEVRKVEIIPADKTFALCSDDLKNKIFLRLQKEIEFPEAIRIYPKISTYSGVRNLVSKISKFAETKTVRGSGENLKKIFLFLKSVKKIEIAVFIFLLWLFAAAFLATAQFLRETTPEIKFLRERNYSRWEIFLNTANIFLLLPLVSTAAAIGSLLIFRQIIGINTIFLNVRDILLLYIVSNIPFILVLFEK
ncbi:MAG: permease-like cell division protein FtsX [Elusimicrobia bacterium]|nr:permease-like cell division protein FtsX [Elusimicrobiota bacterium]